jgi:hypothetical protein
VVLAFSGTYWVNSPVPSQAVVKSNPVEVDALSISKAARRVIGLSFAGDGARGAAGSHLKCALVSSNRFDVNGRTQKSKHKPGWRQGLAEDGREMTIEMTKQECV